MPVSENSGCEAEQEDSFLLGDISAEPSQALVVYRVKPAIHSLSKAEQPYKTLEESSLAFPTLHSAEKCQASNVP